MQSAALVEPGDAAAARTDLENIDHRHLHRQGALITADQSKARRQRMAVIDDAGLGGGAAHVEGDGLAKPHGVAERLGADDTGGGA